MICDKCKKFFMSGNHPITGVPNGVKLITESRKSITLCASCLIELGQMDNQQKDAFFADLTERSEGLN